MSVFVYCVFDCEGHHPNDHEMVDHYKDYVKEHYAPLVSKYLKSLESDDKKQRKITILDIISYFDMKFNDDDYPWDYKRMIKKRRIDYCNMRCRYKLIEIEDPRMFWFRKLIKEDISEVEICRMLLTCQELGEYEIGISLGQEYVEYMEKRLRSELLMSLVNKHIEVLKEELHAKIEHEDREDMNSMSISDYRDYRRELEEESWDAMTGGMYGDYDGDIDMDNLGY